MVLMKFEPVPPTPENKGTCVPSGAIRTAVRAESVGKAALSWTVILATLNVPLKLGMVSVELSVPGPVAGRGGDRLAECCPTGSTADRRSSRSGP